MANDFLIQGGFDAIGDSTLSGSLTISGSISGSFYGNLYGTASWAYSSSTAINSVSASYLNPLNQTVILTGSIILSSSAPPAVPGGIYYDGTDFYLGF